MVQLVGPRWLWTTPDLDEAVGDMSERTVKSLARPAPYPDLGPGLDGEIYGFDGKLDAADPACARAGARRLGVVMGTTAPGAVAVLPDAKWLFADPAHEDLRKEVPGHLLATSDSFIGDEWTYAQHLANADVEDWLEEKRTGSGRDPRLAPPHRADDGRPHRLVEGELLRGMLASGLASVPYHHHWVKTSGVAPGMGLVIEHGVLCTVLHVLICYDMRDVLNLSGVEQVSRINMMVERAVRRNATSPDIDGLDIFLASAFDSTGGVITRDFDKLAA